jgi:tetratricopeptide (TPR) repeat protein
MRLVLIAALVAVAGVAEAGGADELAEARRRRQALDFEGALAALERAIAAGDNDAGRLADAYQLAGELAAGLGRVDEATAAFERLLVLRPDAALPGGTSPKIQAPFDAARARGHRPLAAHAERDGATVTLVVDADPLGLIAGARLRWSGGELRAPSALTIPPGAVDPVLEAIDRHGNTLWSAPLPATAIVAPPVADTTIDRPFWRSPTLWLGGALGWAAIGGIVAWQLGKTQDEWDRLRAEDGQHDYSELRAVEQHGRNQAAFANVSFGIAAAFAVTGVVVISTF